MGNGRINTKRDRKDTKPIATPDMAEKLVKLAPYGFYGWSDSHLGVLHFFNDLGFDISEIMSYSGGRTPSDNYILRGDVKRYGIEATDSATAKLVKRILNIIYTFQGDIVKHFRDDVENELGFKFKEGSDTFSTSKNDPTAISDFNIGKIFGVDRNTATKWLSTLEDSGFSLGRKHNLNFRRLRMSLQNIFGSPSMSTANNYVQIVVNSYTVEYYRDTDLSFRFLSLLDEYTGSQPKSESISSIALGWSKGYLQKIRAPSTEFEEFSKYFKLATTILLIRESSLVFKDNSLIDEFQTRALNLVYDKMVENEMIRKNDAGRAQFNAILYSLYALSEARLSLPEVEIEKFKNSKNPRGFYTFTDLARTISREGYRSLLRDQLIAQTDSVQLGHIIDILKKEAHLAPDSCREAIESVRHYLKVFTTVAEGKTRASYVGDLAHPVLEKIIMEYLASKGILTDFEALVRSGREYKVDSVIQRDSRFLEYIEQRSSIDFNIPESINFITVDYTLTKNRNYIIEKCRKFYQEKDRFLFIVIYNEVGERGYRQLNSINKDIQDDISIPYRENIKVVSAEQYAAFLGLSQSSLSSQWNEIVGLARGARHTGLEANSQLEKLIERWEVASTFFDNLESHSLL